MTQGKAIHATVVKGRQCDGGQQVLGQYAAIGPAYRQSLAGQAPLNCHLLDDLQGLGVTDAGRMVAHAGWE